MKNLSDQSHLLDSECPFAGNQVTDGSFRDARGPNEVSLAHLMFDQQMFQQFVRLKWLDRMMVLFENKDQIGQCLQVGMSTFIQFLRQQNINKPLSLIEL